MEIRGGLSWHRNVSNSLRKEPKWYLRDWSGIADPGKRFETLVACHLLKAVEGWTDLGLGKFSLHYLRDKQQREVDFLVANDGHPWFLVEAKAGAERLSPALAYFQQATGAAHAFQVVMNLQPVMADCFTRRHPHWYQRFHSFHNCFEPWSLENTGTQPSRL